MVAAAQHFLHALSDLFSSTPSSPGIIIPTEDAANLLMASGGNPISSSIQSNATTAPFTFDKMEISLSSLPTLLSSLAVKNQDVLKLMLVGFVIETSRRFAFTLWTRIWAWFAASWYISVLFESNDEVYHWMMHWLGNQAIWETSREICVNTAYSLQNNSYFGGDSTADNYSNRQLKYYPVYDVPNWFKYKGTWISVTRCRNDRIGNPHKAETLTLCLYTRKHSFLREILQEAKEISESEDVVNIYSIGGYNEWYRSSSRRKRPLRSVILESEVKEGILEDAVDFLSNEEWYVERGIPYRRGYLLHGVPGSGKTSLIHSIAGELGLDVYIVSLSKSGLGDSELNEIFCSMPSRSILLIEDIDAVFRKATAVRKAVAGSSPQPSNDNSQGEDHGDENKETNGSFFKKSDSESFTGRGGITLSGLLNALDGIAAAEGRLLFATTNCFTALDEALRRPGRMDVHVEFKNATKWQARELFWSFFEPCKKTKKEKVKDTLNIKKIQTSPVSDSKSSAIRFARLVVPEVVTLEELSMLSDEFGEVVPVDVFSVASLQGYLMLYKERPRSALEGIEKWVEEELVKKNVKEKVGVANPEKKTKTKKKEKEKEKEKEEKEEKEKAEDSDELEPDSESEQCHDDQESSLEIVEASASGGFPQGNGIIEGRRAGYPRRRPGRFHFRYRGQRR